jgi:hypothetical protein
LQKLLKPGTLPVPVKQIKGHSNQEVGKSHKINDARIDAFGYLLAPLLYYRSAHGTLAKCILSCQKDQEK